MAQVSTPSYDIYALRGRRIIETHILSGLPPSSDPLPQLPPSVDIPQPNVIQAALGQPQPFRVGIIGAGTGGLYAGMMLQDQGVAFEILEATDHTGGRLFTYKFSNAPHDYYDVGAMRFPEIPAMQRLFDLFDKLNLTTASGKRIPYIFSSPEAFRMYNTIRKRNYDTAATFDWEETGVPTYFLQQGANQVLWDSLYQYFIPELLKDLKDPKRHIGWDNLMKFDQYSTRGYLAIVREFDAPIIDWLESVDKGTAWYDQSLAETVLEAIAFGVTGPKGSDAKFWCLDGGSQVLSSTMETYIKKQNPNAIQFNKFVTAIEVVRDQALKPKIIGINVRVKGEQNPRFYNQVICTLPLPVLRTLDIDRAGLDIFQTNALRQLQYGPAVKVGIKFKTQWWKTAVNLDHQVLNIVGGQSYTDRNARTVVYPSYGIETTPPETTVLIASYCWSQDAYRLGGLTNAESKERLKDLMFRDLAAVHHLPYEFLVEQYVDMFAFDWQHDPLTQGAFAFFGPQEFSFLYKYMNTAAAEGHLHFAGEALSSRHAWVVGALDSAARAVDEMLVYLPQWKDKLEKFEKTYGVGAEWQASPEFSEGDHIPYDGRGRPTNLIAIHNAVRAAQRGEDFGE